MNPAIMMAMGDGGVVNTYSDDVFAAYVYNGTNSSQTINNGINLAGKGGLVWEKQRNVVQSHYLIDTVRGAGDFLNTDSTSGSAANAQWITSFNNNGFNTGTGLSASGVQHLTYTFRKAAKFFDIVTYTGDGTANRSIAHSLGVVAGMVITKNTGAVSNWRCYHTGTGTTSSCYLESTAAANAESTFPTTPTSTNFFVQGAANTSGQNYIAYVFADDSTTNGIIRCGTFTTDGSGNATVTALNWEPQFVTVKASSASGDWIMLDQVRGWNLATDDRSTLANSTAAESTATDYGNPTGNGFVFKGAASTTYIYLAIRRSNKPPTTGTQIFAASARTGTGASATSTAAGFPPDLVITKKRSSTTLTGARFVDRLRGKTIHFDSSAATAEVTTADTITGLDSNTGMSIGADATTSAFNTNTHTYVDLFFKRATGVLDIVCDTGTGAAHTISHNLGVIPELIIRKGRSGATQGEIYCSGIANTEKLVLSSTAAKATDTTSWNSTTPTASVFTVGTGANVNTNAATYVSYLFATLAGVSKVGSYTGNGTSINIDCGFVAGARFVLIKQTNSTGDWFLWDTVRGIVAGNDPHISLNTTAAEVTTDDTIDPLSSGFTVNQVAATNVNVTSATYIFLALS